MVSFQKSNFIYVYVIFQHLLFQLTTFQIKTAEVINIFQYDVVKEFLTQEINDLLSFILILFDGALFLFLDIGSV